MTSADERAAASLLERKDELAREITAELYDAHPELLERYGEDGRAKCLEDVRYHLEFLAPSVALGDPHVFEQYTLWLVSLLEARGIPRAHVRASFAAMQQVIQRRLGDDGSLQVMRALRGGMASLETGEGSR